MKRRIIGLALMLCMLASAAPKAFAIADSETYTVAVTATNSIVLTAVGSTDFGSIAPGGVEDTSLHVITVGDGTVNTSTSYIQSNDASAPAKQYTLTFAGTDTDTVALADIGGNAILTVANAGATSDVKFHLTDGAAIPSGRPALGDPAETPVVFSVLTGALNIPAASSVPFDATTKKAPLSMKIDLKEDSVTMADADAELGFVMTFTCVGL